MQTVPRGQVKDSPATAGLPEAERKLSRHVGIYRIRPSNGCLRSGFPLAAAGRPRSPHAAGGFGMGQSSRLSGREDELHSHFHTCASHFPAAEECGGASATAPALGAAGCEFWHGQCRAGTVDFSSPDPRVISGVAEGAGGGRHVADGPGGAALTPGWGLRLRGQCRLWQGFSPLLLRVPRAVSPHIRAAGTDGLLFISQIPGEPRAVTCSR